MKYISLILFLSFQSFSIFSQDIQFIKIEMGDVDSLEQRFIRNNQFTQFATVENIESSVDLTRSKTEVKIKIDGAKAIALEYEILNINKLKYFKLITDNNEYDLLQWAESRNLKTISPFVNNQEITISISTTDHSELFQHISFINVFPAFKEIPVLADASLDCDIELRCYGDNIMSSYKGVSKIYVVHEEGIGFCTGTLMNNTNEDNTPYILSGFHCMDGYTPRYDMWQFIFNEYYVGCDSVELSNHRFVVQGCEEIAGWSDSDFLLLKLNEDIPYHRDVIFHGWDARGHTEDSIFMLHHPRGTAMKISIDTDEYTIVETPITWNTGVKTPAHHHFKLEYDSGAQEGGSSGAPAFNQDGLIIGQLNGGRSNCTNPLGYYGRMSKSWDGGGTPDTRLKDWLDPNTMNTTIYNRFESDYRQVEFIVKSIDNRPIPGVHVQLNNGINAITDFQGIATFDSLLTNSMYHFTLSKSSINPINGLSGKDVTMLTRIIVGLNPISEDYIRIIGDVNRDGLIDWSDRILLIEYILKLKSLDTTHWFFDVDKNQIDKDIYTIKVRAYKLGDLNLSADPSK